MIQYYTSFKNIKCVKTTFPGSIDGAFAFTLPAVANSNEVLELTPVS